MWICHDDFKYARTALFFPQNYFGGHNATLKSYTQTSSSYYRLRVCSNFIQHTKACFQGQQRKQSIARSQQLSRLPKSGLAQYESSCKLILMPNVDGRPSKIMHPLHHRSLHKICAWSLQLKTKKLKWQPKQSSLNGCVNLVCQPRFTQLGKILTFSKATIV